MRFGCFGQAAREEFKIYVEHGQEVTAYLFSM